MTTLVGSPTSAAPDRARRTVTGLVRPLRRAGAGRWVFRGMLAFFVALIVASYAIPLVYQLRGERLLVVTSGSMAPEIQPGDAVVIRPISSAAQLRVGQVVTFLPRMSTMLITHRIEELVPIVRRDDNDQPVLDALGNPILDPYIRTKGDANRVTDANVTPASQVRGIVSEVHAGWGYPLGWAHSPVGRLLLFGPPLLMLIGAEVLSRMPADVRGRGRIFGRRPDRRAGDDRGGAPTSDDEERDDARALV